MSELVKALAKALPEVEGASKDSVNPHFKSKYADLGNVIEAIRPVTKHGLWFRQAPIEHERGACIETFYVHSSGEEMSAGQCFVPASKQDAQGFGSALTYCRRYGLLAAFGIAPEDDDGNAASRRDGQSEGTFSRPANDTPKKREKLDGPYTSKTSLWSAVRNFTHELHGTGDLDMFEAFLAVPENKALIAQCERDAPQLLDGGEGLPEDYVPINTLIKRMRTDFELIENSTLRAG